MLRRLPTIACLALVTVALTACQTTSPMKTAADDGWSHYGESGHEFGTPVALGSVEGGASDVVVAGTITEVCAVKGCWMTVVDGDDELFVKFKDYGFFVPRNAAGHRVVIHGVTEAQTVSVDDLRHYAEDAGKSPDEIAAITEPETRVTFYADSVYIEGEGLDKPYPDS